MIRIILRIPQPPLLTHRVSVTLVRGQKEMRKRTCQLVNDGSTYRQYLHACVLQRRWLRLDG